MTVCSKQASGVCDEWSLLQELCRLIKQFFQKCDDVFRVIVDHCADVLKQFKVKLVSLLDNDKFWSVVRLIPLVNSIFGGARCLMYLCQNNWTEAIKSGLYVPVGLAAFFVPLYLGVACILEFLIAGGINNIIGGGVCFLIDLATDEKLRSASWESLEDVVYQNIIKVTPLLGVGYCLTRALFFLCKGYFKTKSIDDKQKGWNSAKDLLINVVSVAIAYAIQILVSTELLSDITCKIEECLASVQNSFARMVLNVFKRALQFASTAIQNGGRYLTQCANSFLNFANSVVAKTFVFPFVEPKDKNFIITLKNAKSLTNVYFDSGNIKKEMIIYIVKCLADGYKNITDDGKSALELAFESKIVALLQAFIAFWPVALDGSLYAERRKNMLNMKNEDDPEIECRKFILKKSLNEQLAVDSQADVKCCDNHQNYHLILIEPIVYRPANLLNGTSRVLCLDGGGTLGLVTLQMLRQLEKRGMMPIADYFNVIVGTSTGGLIALLLVESRMTVEQVQMKYFELKNKIFDGQGKSNTKALEIFLKDQFKNKVDGKTKLMGEIPNSTRVIITATIQDDKYKRKFFTNDDDESASIPIWEVARCTTAAPGFFAPFEDKNKIVHVDGGMTWNNPVFAAFHYLDNLENRQTNQDLKLKNSIIVSMGTGRYDNPKPVGKLNVNFQSGIGKAKSLINGTLNEFINLLANEATKKEGAPIDDALLVCKHTDSYFYRLNPSLPENLLLNETDDEKLVNATYHAKAFAGYNRQLFDEIANMLK